MAEVLADTVSDASDVPNAGRSTLFWKLALAGIATIWGFSFVIMKGAVNEIPAFYLLAWRFSIAAIILFAVFFKNIRAHLDASHIGIGVLMGVLEGIAYSFQTVGLADTTAGKNAFLTGVYCVLVPFFAYVFFREKLTRYNVGAAVLCLAGIGLVALDDLSIRFGDALTLCGAVFYALQLLTASHAGRGKDANATTFWMFATVAVMCIAGSFLFEEQPPLSVWTPELAGQIFFLAAVCTCFNLLMQNIAMPKVEASAGALLLSLESPTGVFFGVILADEVLTGRVLLGFFLIFVAIVLSETHFSFLKRKSS